MTAWNLIWFLAFSISLYYHWKRFAAPKRCAHCLELAVGSLKVNGFSSFYCSDHKEMYVQGKKNRFLGK